MNTKTIIPTVLLVLSLAVPAFSSTGGEYEKGVAYLRAGKSAEALKMLEPLAASRKDDPYVHYHLGIAYYQTGRLDEAFTAFRRTLALSGGAQQGGEFRLGVAFSNLGVEYYRSGRHDQAAACFSEALVIDPEDGDSRYYLGLTEMERGEFDAALKDLTAARELLGGGAASAAAAGNAIALVHYRMDDNEAAAAEFSRTLELDPDNVEALYYLGQINYKEHGYAAARIYFDRITHAAASDEKARATLFTTFFNMGVDFQDRGKSQSAAEMFERASLLDPDDADTHFYIGYNLMALERYEDAAAEFRQALSLDPGLERARVQMEVAGKFASESALEDASARMSAGDCYAALPLYEKALSLDPSSPAAQKGLDAARKAVKEDTRRRAARARDLLSDGRYLDAMAESDELSRLDPGSAEAASLRRDISSRVAGLTGELIDKASRAEKGGRLGEAMGHYAAVLEVDPRNDDARQGLARAESTVRLARQKASRAAEGGLLIEARAAYRELLGYLPDDPDAKAGLKGAEESMALELARHLKQANESFGSEDYTMAAYHNGRALELDPENREAGQMRERIRDRSRELVIRYVREGDSLLEEGLREKASESYEAALLLDPDNAGARSGIAKSRRAAPQPSGTEDEVRRLYLKGVEHYTKGELDQAVAAWREVARIDPGNEKALSSIKRAEEKMKRTEDTSSQTAR